MKKIILMVAVAIMTAVSAQAQEEQVVNAYFTQGEMPDMMNLVVNTDHKLIKSILEKVDGDTAEALKPIKGEIAGLEARHNSLNDLTKGVKWEDVPQETKDALSDTEKKLEDERSKKNEIISGASKDNKVVHQLIDLALLQNGMLRGEALNKFVQRSVELIEE